MPKLVRKKLGYYHYEPKPSNRELEQFYAEKYYQQGQGSYELSYTAEEIAHAKLKAWLIYHKISQLLPERKETTVMDIGCGEGWTLDQFYQRQYIVSGFDFSKYGLEKFHPHLKPFFEQGDIYTLVKKKNKEAKKVDIIIIGNVIEHVVDPVGLLKNIKNLMRRCSILVIVVPNDFSPLHHHLLRKRFIKEKFWLNYPEHLSYFNKVSMTSLLTSLGLEIKTVVADNPIDLNLLNDNSNYIDDKTKGKNTHFFRIRMDNFLAETDREKFAHLYETLGAMGVGRNLTYYCSLANR